MEFAALFYGLVAAHFVADYMQPASLVAWTKRNGRGLYVHTGIYAVLTGAVLAGYGAYWIPALAALVLTHFIYDRFKYDMSGRAKGRYLHWFLLDQALHGGTILAAVLLLAGTGESPVTRLIGGNIGWVVFLCAVLGASFGGSIVVFEAGRTFAPENDGRIILFRDRLPGIIERAAACWILFISPAPVLTPLAFSYSVFRAIKTRRETGNGRRGLVELIASIAGFAMAAMLYYSYGLFMEV